MSRPMDPVEETKVTRREVGYGWSYSFEYGASGNRQKLILTGNTELMARALTELKGAKLSLMKLAEASVEELNRPPPYEAYKKNGEGPLH